MGFDAQLISTMALPWCVARAAMVTLNQRLGRDNRRLRVCGFELSRCHVKLAWNEMIHVEFVEVRWPAWNGGKEVAEPRQRRNPI